MEDHADTDSTPDLSVSSASSDASPTVAVIGCGPGGMFFLHALATRRKQLEATNDLDGLSKLPSVTCFEMSSSPGGVWRSNDSHTTSSDNNTGTDTGMEASEIESNEEDRKEEMEKDEDKNAQMYQALWTNANSGNIEFFDYTFLDHFNRSMPLFLPRKHVLEYMIARVTQHEDVFRHVRFNTAVKSVTCDDLSEKFAVNFNSVDAADAGTGTDNDDVTTEYFDKCIWASGLNGKPYCAETVKEILTKGKYKGTMVHSAEIDKIGADVKGKRILMVGDSFSAEDLALQCIKLGAERIYATSRQCMGVINDHVSWPEDRVEVLKYSTLSGIKDDGTGTTIITKGTRKSDGQEGPLFGDHEIEDISIVIFCTGYETNFEILGRFLKPYLVEDYGDYDDWDSDGDEFGWEVEKDWKMKPNVLTPILGDVTPGAELEPNSDFVAECTYKRANIENPNMMYIHEQSSFPLLEIDIAAYRCMRLVLGEVELPEKDQMRHENRLHLLDDMDNIGQRLKIDEEYRKAVVLQVDWYDPRVERIEYECQVHAVKCVARAMEDARYPISFGTNGELNKMGKRMLHHSVLDMDARNSIPKQDKGWRTFRDTDTDKYSSMITGTKPIALKGRWIDIDIDED
uniref:Uncharacterized protein n=1 Tax=Chaetoceros debilis TaxID=122233 RepID=A0A7S3VAU8_9STRA|mmetsp:Transcript_5758/g.8097  ORF Transcript_5758/g.8097 Transcript_5758/m.8097 type:complete len:628 (+) Transcript_5758:79-1962(+)|eukprot:CAMPEP_0194085870 /NCGR_PEP_ID=MMETSP0149-20130528/19116_1 /TAXON_ID=122233 /ORGANISM="Chaetoceros debilis, Strain MM31A-1" /LENGTH=627 /DNA_ID=CAMNT_0038768853 /DNA_START=13 /DNA_END=1896 /DNA_ORIENTATION=+